MKKLLLLSMLLSAPAFAEGVCIVCPPGYDCSGATPVLASGTAGQVLTRTATGAEWKALPAPVAMTWNNITGKPETFAPSAHTHDYVPTTRKVNSKALSSDITISASDVSGVPTSRTVAGLSLTGDITAAQLKTALGF